MPQRPNQKRIALVAHDQKKAEMIAWSKHHIKRLEPHLLWATGTTGNQVTEATGLKINLLKSGPLGGDQQLGAMIVEGEIDILFFFTDPLSSMPHDVDVKALLRISTLQQTVIACNRATADYVILSDLFRRPSEVSALSSVM
ncbi:MAG: methylglyoxal synthase [Rhodobacteraceae bacterium]|nr:methylglyoxal synthase [Paracoccaceae bacterium]